MRGLLKYAAVVLLLSFVMHLYTSTASADESVEGLSLGGATLLDMTPSDPKVSEHAVLTAKYGFKVAKDFMPYFGTGLAYTYQPDSRTGDITNLRTGIAAQVGFSYFLDTGLTLKLDYKYLSLPPEKSLGDVRETPQSIGIGLDINF